MMREIKKLLPQSHGTEGRVRCFAHVLSLVVKVCTRRGSTYEDANA